MPIKVTCQCGVSFVARDEWLGKWFRCPKCGAVLLVQSAAPQTGQVHAAPADDFPWEGAAPVAAKPWCEPPAHSPLMSNDRRWIVVDTGLLITLASLVAGGAAFAIITVAALAMLTSPLTAGHAQWRRRPEPRADVVERYVCGVVRFAPHWMVRLLRPKLSNARTFIQAAAVAWAALAAGLMMLMQLADLALCESAIMPNPPDWNNGKPPSAADMKKFRMDIDRAAKQCKSTPSKPRPPPIRSA